MAVKSLGLTRPLVVQQFRTFSLLVGVVPLPIEPTVDKTKLITSFVISNPIGGVSVFMGNQGVLTTTGLEIQPGTAPDFVLDQGGRQLYEVQAPLLDISAGLQCRTQALDGVPFVVWDMSTIFLVATAPQLVSVSLFPTMYL